MSLMDLKLDLDYDIHKHALKIKGKWWANVFFYNKEVEEYKSELRKEAASLSGALKLMTKLRNYEY